MSTTELTIVQPDIESALTTANLAPEGVASIRSSFSPHFTAFQEIATTAQTVKPNAPKLARTVRLKLREVRIASEKTRVSLNEDSQRRVKAINGVNNLLLYALTPIEEAMSAIEKAEEIEAAKRITDLAEVRRAQLTVYTDPQFYDLGNMPEAQWTALLSGAKTAKETAEAALKKADEDRIAKIKADEETRAAKEKADAAERARLAAENARLAEEARKAREAQEATKKAAEAQAKALADKAAAEQAKRDAQAAKEKAAREAEAKKLADAQKAKDDAAKAEQAKKDAQVAKERADLVAKTKAAQDALDAAKAKEDKRIANEKAAEAQKLADENAAAKRAAKAPDKSKLLAFAASIKALPIPVTTDPALNTQLSQQASKMVAWVEGLAAKL